MAALVQQPPQCRAELRAQSLGVLEYPPIFLGVRRISVNDGVAYVLELEESMAHVLRVLAVNEFRFQFLNCGFAPGVVIARRVPAVVAFPRHQRFPSERGSAHVVAAIKVLECEFSLMLRKVNIPCPAQAFPKTVAKQFRGASQRRVQDRREVSNLLGRAGKVQRAFVKGGSIEAPRLSSGTPSSINSGAKTP